MARLLKYYRESVVPELKKEFNYGGPMEVPRLEKIVINMGIGETTQNSKAPEQAQFVLNRITGQKSILRRSKKAIASFKLREGLAVGCMVTLRGQRMYEFLDRLVSIALPRTKDFRGVSAKGFDGRGNYSLGIKENIVFPEIEVDKVDKIRGMNIAFVTTAKTDNEGRELLKKMGMPFRQPGQKA